jgi:FkbM family methyltransferase
MTPIRTNKPITYDADVFVAGLYEQLLGRTATPEEVASHVISLLSGATDAAGMVARFVSSDEYTQRVSSEQASFINAHDQFGEITLLLQEWALQSVAEPLVVDIGARGRDRSNSYDLMKHFGWRGLLVEANPALLSNIRAEFDGLSCVLVGTAVSDYNGSAEFTIGLNDDVSSLDPAAASSWGDTRGTVSVEVRRLPELLAEHGIPHEFGLLSLDIEGEDVKVLVDLIAGSEYRPNYIIIEASQDFQITSLDALDVPGIVRETYEVFTQTRANLLLRRIDAPHRCAASQRYR